jgi:isoquinoline 1-oxidoreductase subunit alpha
MISLSINGRSYDVDVEPDTPLLWVLRDTIGLAGTRYGCGIAQCGACTVHIDDAPVRSCSMPIASITAGAKIMTIEGLAQNGTLHPVQPGVDRSRCPTMRILPEWNDHGRRGAVQG